MSVFNITSRLSITAALRIGSAAVILFVLLCIGAKDVCISAQTNEKEPGIAQNEKSDNSQAKPGEGLSSAEPLCSPGPEVICETVEPVPELWGNTEGFGEKMDWIHANLFKTVQNQVQKVDYWFKPPAGKERLVKLSRFRIGMYGEGKINRHNGLNLKSPVDFDSDIEMPNMKRRMKLHITTNDPTLLPGRDITEQHDESVRTAISREWWSNVTTHTGVRMRLHPDLFANVVWAPARERHIWTVYPEQKFYWEGKTGFGEISTLAFDHWKNRWNTRLSTSVKWSEQDRNDDHQNERRDEGFRWSEVFIFGYATELLDETQLGRIISGNDVARGWGLRLATFGGFHLMDEYRAGLFRRFPLRKKWMYFMIEPEVSWKKVNNWNREWTIKCGIEMFFWGSSER